MSDIVIRNVPSATKRALRHAAFDSDMTIGEFVIDAVLEKINGVQAGRKEVQAPSVEKRGVQKVSRNTERKADTADPRGARELTRPETGKAGVQPPSLGVGELAVKYDGEPDTCPTCRMQLVIFSGSKTECPKCKAQYKRMA